MLTGEEIEAALGEDIIIHPYDPDELRGCTYNLKVGQFLWLHDNPQAPDSAGATTKPLVGDSTDSGIRYSIPPGCLVSVLTKEVVYVDRNLAGLFHAKVDMVTKGFSHISTTLDPGWIGPLLITMWNCSKKHLILWEGETFVKLTFHRLSHHTRIDHNNPPGRVDRLQHQQLRLPEGQENFLEAPVNSNLSALRELFFESKGWKTIRANREITKARTWDWVKFILTSLALVVSITSPWWFNPIFGLDPGDEALSGILAATLTSFFFFLQQFDDPPWKKRPKI